MQQTSINNSKLPYASLCSILRVPAFLDASRMFSLTRSLCLWSTSVLIYKYLYLCVYPYAHIYTQYVLNRYVLYVYEVDSSRCTLQFFYSPPLLRTAFILRVRHVNISLSMKMMEKKRNKISNPCFSIMNFFKECEQLYCELWSYFFCLNLLLHMTKI